MAVLFVTEWPEIAADHGGNINTFKIPAVAEQTVAVGAGSVASNAFNARTAYVTVSADVTCSIAWGTAPTASATTMRLAANERLSFQVPKGASYKVAVITNT